MPHKHKRKHGLVPDGSGGNEENKNDFDLPPDKKARSLSVHKSKAEDKWEGFDNGVTVAAGKGQKVDNKRRKTEERKKAGNGEMVKDDTPKNFARLMAWQTQGKRLRKGLDDGSGGAAVAAGEGKNKKRKTRDIVDAMAESAGDATRTDALSSGQGGKVEKMKVQGGLIVESQLQTRPPQDAKEEGLKIKPGERLSDFALRVDQAMPLSNVPKHGTKDKVLGLKTKLTKHNKNLQRMQTEWRNAENKIKAKREEGEDEALDRKEEDQLLWMDVKSANANQKGKKRRKAGVLDDADPWKVLERKRREAGDGRGGGVVGGLRASDAVQAPPMLKPIKNMFKEPQQRTSSALKTVEV